MSKSKNNTIKFIISLTKHNVVASDGWKGSTCSQVWFDAINYDDVHRTYPLKEDETITSVRKAP